MNDVLLVVFLTGVGCLFVHELDAIQQGEYRFFFGWLGMNDTMAYRWLTALHLPLFVLIMANVSNPTFWAVWDVFLVVHALLHWALRRHPLIQFNNWFSWVWILGGAGMGLLHLVGLSIL